ncbi:hypothetical protein ACPPVQ_05850 [Diaminobutyricibacter sp. McL0618]|uniref:hypothetical protein n=1 Tax=Leifsonia sp. McL0618 TaxID=3415677 RepID=UPI003CEC38C7
MKRFVSAGAATVVLLSLSGCVSPPSPFDGERKASDQLPAVVSEVIPTGDASSSRYQGKADGRELYLVKGKGDYQFCLAYTDGTKDGSGASCSGGPWVKVTFPDQAEFEVQLHGFADKPADGQKQVSKWVRQTAPARGT